MKKLLAATMFALAAFAPVAGAHCDGHGDSTATAPPPDQLGAAPTPAATRAPSPAVAKATTPKAAKPKQAVQQAQPTPRAPAADPKVNLVSTN